MAGLQVFLVCAAIFTAASGSHMQGGTISFKATEKTHVGWVVDFKYKSSFISGYEYTFYWGCNSGDCGYEINHWIQPVDNRTRYPSPWYQSEGHVKRRVDNDKPFQLLESGCCWVGNMYYEGGWQMITSVDLGVRSDTNMPNSSPVTAIIPILRIPQNCASTINLLGHDPDGDIVSCRHGYYYGECSFCHWNFNVDHKQCTLSISSWMSTGSYVVELILEDFPKSDIYLRYNDGTMVYKSRPYNRESRELSKDSQKYYWYSTIGPTESVSVIETYYPETTETNGVVDISTDVYTTDAVTDIFKETTIELLQDVETTPHYYTTAETITELQDPETTPHYYTTAETITELLQDPETTPHYYTTAETIAEFQDPETTPHYYTTAETIAEFQDPETTPHYYTTAETITELLQDPETTPHYYTTAETIADFQDPETTPHYYTTAETITELQDPETTPHYYTTAETIADVQDPETTPHYYTTAETITELQDPETTPHYYTTAETITELLQDPDTTPHYYTTAETITELLQDPETTPHYYTTAETITELLQDPETTPHYYTTAETITELLQDPDTTPHYYTTAETITELLQDPDTTPHYYTTAETITELLQDPETTPHYYTTAETITELLQDPKTTTNSIITESTTADNTPYSTAATVEDFLTTTSILTTEHYLTKSVTFPYETTRWDSYLTSSLPNDMDSLSKISLQFLVEVTSATPSCTLGDYRPKFISPTPRQGERLLANAGSVFQLYLSAQAAYESVSDFKVSGPAGIIKSSTGKSKSTIKSMVVEWTPSKNNVGEHVAFCFVAETSNGYQSEMRCVIVKVGPSSLDNIELICHENTMTLIAAKSSDHELYENQFRLNDPKCLVSSNRTHLIASVAYNSCGTQTEETEDNIVFKNQATSFSHESNVITRKHGVSIPFNCSFPKKNRVSASFRAHKSDYVFAETGFGNFTYKFQFYTDDRFVEVETQYPMEVPLQELLYMEIQVSSAVPNVQLFVESCKATPHDNPYDPTFYSIIQNGCIKDETLVVYGTSRTQYKFGMEAFAFIGEYSEVYISCTVILCKFGAPGTRCTQGCIRKSLEDSNSLRRRRSLTSESQQHFISQGPIRMKRQSNSNADQGASPSLNVNTLVISLAGVVIVGLLGFIAHIYTKRVKQSSYELLKTQAI